MPTAGCSGSARSRVPNSAVEAANFNFENFGRPGETHALTDEPLRIADLSRMATMRKKMADGSATPEEIAAVRAGGRTQGS